MLGGVISDRNMNEIKAALAGAKGKEHTLIFSAKEVRSLLNTIVNQNQRIERFEKKIANHIAQPRKMVPEGWKLVLVEPTDEMHVAARDWSTVKYGKAIGLDASEGCYKAMLEAAPKFEEDKQ